MRNWWKLLAWGLVSLGGITSAANAQFPPMGPGGFGAPGMGGPGMMGPGPGMGGPGMMGPGPGMGGPGMMGPGAGMAPGMPTSMGPTAFTGNPNLGGMPAEFPNPAVPSKEPASPFSIRDDGMPGAFSELVDNRRPVSPAIVFRTEYLGWWITPGPSRVPLVTSTTNLAGGEVGAQGEQNTVYLVPASESAIDYKLLSGVRAALGIAPHFLPPLEVSGFSFIRNYNAFAGGTNNGTGLYLARPVNLADVPVAQGIGLNTVEFVNVPGFAGGTVSVYSRLSFWNVEPNFVFNFCDNGTIRLDLLLGYRHMDLYESLQINNNLVGTNANVNFGGATFPAGFTTTVRDAFNARNAFDGGQVGIRAIIDCDAFKIFGDFKLAMGCTSQFLTIDGTSTLAPGMNGQASTTLPGGILALPSNIGHHSERSFTVIPEVNLNFSYQFTQRIRGFAGYNLIYWSNVIRPGDHLNNVVDGRTIPTDQNFVNGFRGQTPSFPTFATRDLWAHGFNIGLEIGF